MWVGGFGRQRCQGETNRVRGGRGGRSVVVVGGSPLCAGGFLVFFIFIFIFISIPGFLFFLFFFFFFPAVIFFMMAGD